MINKSIAVVLHCYDLRWARELNATCKEMFICPVSFREKSYLPGRTLQHQYTGALIDKLRKLAIKEIFFVNYFEDFSPDFIKAGFIKKIYGIVHGSNSIKTEVGGDKRLIAYEKGVSMIADKLFVPTEYVQRHIDAKTSIVGLPILRGFDEPRTSDVILFNHRLNKERNPMKLLELPERHQKNIVISTPKGSTDYIGALKKKFKFHFNPPDSQYDIILSESGFGISLSDGETFGYSVSDGIASGLCYFVPDNNQTCYKETTISELRFKDISDLSEKIDFYKKHQKERFDVVKKSQDKLKKYAKNEWKKTILKELGK